MAVTKRDMNPQSSFQDVFERQMTERVHAFVGLMGIPIMRRDYRVKLGDQVTENLVEPSTSLTGLQSTVTS